MQTDYREKQSGSHDLLIGGHGPHCLQLLPSKLGCIRTGFQGRRVNDIQDQRNQHKRRQPGNNSSFCPVQPPNCLVNRILSKSSAQRIRRHRSQKHRRRNTRSLEASKHQPRPQPVLGAVAGVTATGHTQGLNKWKENPTCPSRNRRNCRRQQCLAENQAISQP